MRNLIMAAAILLAACSAPEESAKDIDYDAMNKAAEGPGTPITPDPINFAELEKYNLFDAGCSVEHPDGGLLLIARMEAAHFLLDGQLVTLSPHPGTEELPYGVATDYDGQAYSLQFTRVPGTDAVEGPELASFEGTATIRDSKERVVFQKRGRIACGA